MISPSTLSGRLAISIHCSAIRERIHSSGETLFRILSRSIARRLLCMSTVDRGQKSYHKDSVRVTRIPSIVTVRWNKHHTHATSPLSFLRGRAVPGPPLTLLAPASRNKPHPSRPLGVPVVAIANRSFVSGGSASVVRVAGASDR